MPTSVYTYELYRGAVLAKKLEPQDSCDALGREAVREFKTGDYQFMLRYRINKHTVRDAAQYDTVSLTWSIVELEMFKKRIERLRRSRKPTNIQKRIINRNKKLADRLKQIVATCQKSLDMQ